MLELVDVFLTLQLPPQLVYPVHKGGSRGQEAFVEKKSPLFTDKQGKKRKRENTKQSSTIYIVATDVGRSYRADVVEAINFFRPCSIYYHSGPPPPPYACKNPGSAPGISFGGLTKWDVCMHDLLQSKRFLVRGSRTYR